MAEEDPVAAVLRELDSTHGELRMHLYHHASPAVKRVRWACANLISAMAHTHSQSVDMVLVAFEILDRYICSGVELPPTDPPNVVMALSGVIAILASKTTEAENVLDVDDLTMFCGRRLGMTLVAAELEVANRIGFAFPTPAAGYFFEEVVGRSASPVTRSLAAYYSEFAIASPLLLQYSPMLLIAASTEMARSAARCLDWVRSPCGHSPAMISHAAGAIWDATRGITPGNCLIMKQLPRAHLDMAHEAGCR
jgi:hypothetical protein